KKEKESEEEDSEEKEDVSKENIEETSDSFLGEIDNILNDTSEKSEPKDEEETEEKEEVSSESQAEHVEKINAILEKHITEATPQELFNLLNNAKYIELLPKENDLIDLDAVKNLPEYDLLGEDYQNMFIGQLRMLN